MILRRQWGELGVEARNAERKLGMYDIGEESRGSRFASEEQLRRLRSADKDKTTGVGGGGRGNQLSYFGVGRKWGEKATLNRRKVTFGRGVLRGEKHSQTSTRLIVATGKPGCYREYKPRAR